MPEPDPLPSIKTPWGAATPAAGAGAGDVPPIPIPDHTLIRRVGKGSYGEVWLARNVLGVYRAVKIIHRGSFDDDRPFEREFAGMQHFEPVSRSHESQLNILQVGRGPDCFYYVMELADDMGRGAAIDEASYTPRNLRSELLLRGRLPVDECVRLGLALTTALENLHRHGLVHRDIKPSNIVFVNGIPKLADIGLVALAESTMSFVGTEGYLPPEGPGTVQADLFSLGKVLYEISTGRDRQQFPELPTGITELPDRAALAELNEVLLRACAPDAKQRYESAAEMHADLALLQSGKSVARMRAVERRLRFVSRAAAAVMALAILIAGGWFYQAHQTGIVRNLAAEKTSLADEIQRLAESQQEQLIQVNSATGIQRLEADDPTGALPWFVEALRQLEGRDLQREELHRLRLGTLLRYHPRLLGVVPHTGAVHTLAFSPDGRRIAAGSDDGQVQIIDADTVSLQCVLPHTGAVHSVEFSRDSLRVLTASQDHFARVWTLTNRLVTIALAHKDAVRHATFSPDDNSILTASADRTAQVWQASDGSPIGKPLAHSLPVFHACFSPDGRRIATGSGKRYQSGEFSLWDRDTASRIAAPVVLKAPATWTAFSPDGTRAASSCGEAYFDLLASRPGVLVDTATGKMIRKLEHIDRITQVAFSPDGKRLATAALGYEVIVSDAATGEPLIPPLKHTRWVHQAVFSPDGRWIASSSSDGTARVWDATTGVPITPPLKHPGEIFCVAFDPEGRRLATAGDGGLVQVWDIGGCQPALPSFRQYLAEAIADLTADERLVVTYTPRRQEAVNVWDAVTAKQVWSLDMGSGTEYPRHDSSGKYLLTPGTDGQVRLWNLHSGQPVWSPLKVGRKVYGIAFARDASRFAAGVTGAGGNFHAAIWETSTGKQVTPAIPHPQRVHALDMSPDGRWLVTGDDVGVVRVWDAATGEIKGTFNGYSGTGDFHRRLRHIERIQFTRDSSRFLTANWDGTVGVWDTLSQKPSFPLIRHGGIVWEALFSPTEERILSASQDMTAAQWDARTGERIDPPLQHRSILNGASYDGAGRLIATSSNDRTARLWSAETGELLAAPFQHAGFVFSAQLTRDGRRLLTSSADGRAQIWDLALTDWPLADLKRYAEALSAQSLKPDGQLKTLSAAEIAERMAKLRADRPRDFEVRPDQLQRWHRREKIDSQRARNNFATEFHASRTTLPDFD